MFYLLLLLCKSLYVLHECIMVYLKRLVFYYEEEETNAENLLLSLFIPLWNIAIVLPKINILISLFLWFFSSKKFFFPRLENNHRNQEKIVKIKTQFNSLASDSIYISIIQLLPLQTCQCRRSSSLFRSVMLKCLILSQDPLTL